jgi:tRNA 2-selenouridine synthase
MKRISSDLAPFADERVCLVDVRSPAEYAHAHIPGAVSIPLFTDEERARVGTAYVQQGKDAAVRLGLELVGPRLTWYVDTARAAAGERPLLVYCWRGGMRSASLAWLFETAGFDVTTVVGGYRAYRRLVHASFVAPWQLVIVGGRTGSAKTAVLHALAARGEQVLDLEAITNHKGSAFGALMEDPQPSSEQASNDMHAVLRTFDPARVVFVEDESRSVGRVFLPEEFFAAMQRAPIIVLDVPFEQRVDHLVSVYGEAPAEGLIESFTRIRTKLGGERWAAAVGHVQRGELADATRIGLEYYDKTYEYCLTKRPPLMITRCDVASRSIDEVAGIVQQKAQELWISN